MFKKKIFFFISPLATLYTEPFLGNGDCRYYKKKSKTKQNINKKKTTRLFLFLYVTQKTVPKEEKYSFSFLFYFQFFFILVLRSFRVGGTIGCKWVACLIFFFLVEDEAEIVCNVARFYQFLEMKNGENTIRLNFSLIFKDVSNNPHKVISAPYYTFYSVE